MKLSELIHGEAIESHSKKKSDIEIELITSTADEITPNSLFIFIKSINFNIDGIINYVLAKHPAAIICENDMNIESNDIDIIKVKDARHISAVLYSRFYEINHSKIKFIGVTGTNGKTTTATLIYQILIENGYSVGFIGTGKICINNTVISEKMYSMTTPDPKLLYKCIKQMEDFGCTHIVLEVSSHSLHFKKTDAIEFEIGIFTNLSEEHLDFHKNMENYFEAKKSLFTRTKVGIFNIDDKYAKRAYNDCKCKKISVGIINKGDTYATAIKRNGLSGSEYVFCAPGLVYKIKTALPGTYNIYNSLMALCAANYLLPNCNNVKKAVSKINFIDGRMEQIDGDVHIIIDYAHTSEALDVFLKTLKSNVVSGQKLWIVFGCGGDRDRTKRPAMARIAEKYCDNIIVTSDNSRSENESSIIADILSGFENKVKRKVITERTKAIEHAISSANAGDIIAIVGKGHERYNIDKYGVHDFDEREIIKSALKKRKETIP